MQTTIGGDRLGSGNKETVSFRNYERSSHDLGFTWRSSMSAGTLVPFLCKVGLPGDKWDINLNCEVLTLPTIGPLFGSYKVQLDVFEIPVRLYNAKLHMNRLGIGMDMKNIFLPQIELKTVNKFTGGGTPLFSDNEQVNASSLIKYLGVSGLGSYSGATTNPVTRNFNAVPVLALWDVYKNYYANKQEEIGYYIHTEAGIYDAAMTPQQAVIYKYTGQNKGSCLDPATVELETNDYCIVQFPSSAIEPDPSTLSVLLDGTGTVATTVFDTFQWQSQYKRLICIGCKSSADAKDFKIYKTALDSIEKPLGFYGLQEFPLENIDKMRDKILQHTGSGAFIIDSTADKPYNALMQLVQTDLEIAYSCAFSQESLPIKTYQSDLFNNWINTEWIDGAGGISELTAVDTTTGEFTIDALNIASKVYDMLNRIAVSGGSFDDWLEAVYTHERMKGIENPVYCGSLIKELAFEEVISNAETKEGIDNQKVPLGTLAGRGRLTNKNKGGKITISVNEPSYILGLVSLTPRVDYSQGNDWDVNLKTMDDFHKPALDGIGFQDLITEQLIWSDSSIDQTTGAVTQKSLGKQPAWINYMTSVNKTYGAFAESLNSMYMTLNRRYERNTDGSLKDGTTYIDPSKFNNIFAEVALSSQNFWVQIACDITARRKMSAKIIPNL